MSDEISIKKHKYVSFNLKGESYCVKINSVNSVLEIDDYTMVPNTRSFVCGIMNLRGVILTVIDGLDYILGEKINLTTASKILVFEDKSSGFPVGILVDSVDVVLDIDEASISPFVKKGGGSDNLVKGLYHADDDVYVVINEDSLFEGKGI